METSDQQEQYVHLTDLAWRLHELRRVVSIVLVPEQAPFLRPRNPAFGRILVKATAQDQEWFFTWGRGGDQRIPVNAEDSARRIARLLVA
ncbi:hypothetical protein [Sinosporangium siamense]|uniref:Uncharacterized protein n=1 Tax=Sinosporangium siamense TaxID=1367973 RepID=A0A919RPL1_9ACTN|nr:hypothetical protein [Sinosporangium siamense]GII96942.1 hypothetical protein Ssi02_71730 [Sinosporangium siamense]